MRHNTILARFVCGTFGLIGTTRVALTAALFAFAAMSPGLNPAVQAQSVSEPAAPCPEPSDENELVPPECEGQFEAASSSSTIGHPIVEWEKRLEMDERLTAFGDDMFGDGIDPHMGGISFQQTDISVPGNSHLPVVLSRKRSQGFLHNENTHAEFGDWEYLVPRLKLTTATTRPWTGTRCTSSLSSKLTFVSQGTNGGGVWGHEYSNGLTLEVGGASDNVLESPTGAHWPSGTTHVTTTNWYFTCGSASDGGQGFIGRAPNGDVYRFDRVITNTAKPLGVAGGTALGRTLYVIAATEVTDLHGNWVRYTYDSSGRLTRIYANDGRDITLTYSGTSKLVSSASTNGRTWTYSYQQTSYTHQFWNPIQGTAKSQILKTVTLPDSRTWSMNLDGMFADPKPADDCQSSAPTISVKHPTGATATFALRDYEHRFIYAQQLRRADLCPDREPTPPGGPTPPTYPLKDVVTTRNMSVLSKTVTGPGLPSTVWNYAYERNVGPSGSDSDNRTNWTTVTGPGVFITYKHKWVTEPQGGAETYRSTAASSTASPLQIVETTYLSEGSVGSTMMISSPYAGAMRTPRRTQEVIQRRSTDWFKTTNTYDTNFSSSTYSFGAPTKVQEVSSTNSGTRTTDYTYLHKSSPWVKALTAKVVKNGKTFEDHGYDTVGRRLWTDQFGVRAATLTYHTTGANAGLPFTFKDGLNRETRLNSYHRGIPTSLTGAYGTSDQISLSRVVDNNGWITSSTNAKLVTTGYQYNSVGWLTNIDRPAPWSDTTLSYTNISNGPVQTITRGNNRSVINYDGMHRATKVEQRDLSGVAASVYTTTTYDGLGRAVFTSFPSFSSAPTTGVDTTYDALGRVTNTRENVSPYAETITTYLVGNKTSVTDPAGNTTTTTYSGYGSPDDGKPTLIAQPESVSTTMTYDIYGNLLTAVKGGFTQSWTYDASLRLCRHATPETASKVYKYDAADQLIEYAEGQSGTGCLTTLPAADKIVNTYDALGRLKNINFPSTTTDVAMTYDANGNLLTNTRGTAAWTYIYDTADNATEEKLVIDGRTYTINHTFNADGAAATYKSPATRLFDFTPNGFGEPTRMHFAAGSATYANAIGYYPNRDISTVTLQDGHIRTTTQNARQLTTSIKSIKSGVKALDFTYAHDANGRITSITDAAVTGQNRAFTYDGLGRLKTASGPWGSGAYNYDVTGNLTRKQLGSRIVEIQYNASNRLSQFRDTAEANAWQAFVYDARGNVTNNGTVAYGGLTFVYDYANQPVSTAGADASSFVYDGHLKRVKQTINGETIYSVYDRGGTLRYRDNTTTGETFDFLHVAGLNVGRIKKVGGVTTVTVLHGDHLGSPAAGTNSAGGALLWREDRTPFGEARQKPAENADQTGFTGHIEDADTGLTYMQARYYDPVIGRFLSADPVGFASGGVEFFNRYAYTFNNPVNAVDPTGKAPKGTYAGRDYSGLKAARASSERRAAARDAQTKNIHRAQATGVFGTLAVAGAVATAPLVAAESPVIAGAALGGEVAGVGSMVDQLATTGAIDPVNLTFDTVQGAVLGAIGGRALEGAQGAGSHSLGQSGAVATALGVAGSQINGVLEGAQSMYNGGSFSEGYANGVTLGIAKAYTGGLVSPHSAIGGAATDVVVEEALKDELK